jgi:hypothetical protein
VDHNATGARSADACPVIAKELQIVIDVRVEGDEIDGEARGADGERRPFHGWLGLIATLDALLDTAHPPDA